MLKSRLLLATTLLSALAAGPVLAQSSSTNPAQSATPPTATSSTNNSADRNPAHTSASSPNATGTNSSATTASSSSGAQFWTQDSGHQWRTSKLKGLNVYNQNNEKLGDIDDILVDTSGQIKAVIIGVGGFLGIGDHRVAVPFSQLQFTTNTEGRNMAGANRNAGTGNPTSAGAGATGLGSPATPVPNNTASTATSAGSASNTGALGNRSDGTPDRAVLNATKDQLKNAPEFKYNG